MNVSDIRLGEIYTALESGLASVESLKTWVRTSEAQRTCDLRERDIRAGRTALAKLQEAWPRIKALAAEAERSYDLYVTRDRLADACSCHLSAPCGFCTEGQQ